MSLICRCSNVNLRKAVTDVRRYAAAITYKTIPDTKRGKVQSSIKCLMSEIVSRMLKLCVFVFPKRCSGESDRLPNWGVPVKH